jgi:acetyl esterase
MTAPVHPQARLLLADRAAADVPPIWQRTPPEVRKGFAAASSLIGPGPSVARVRDILIPGRAGGIPARVYDPVPNPPGVVVYYHGGGWVIGSVDDWDPVCRALAVSSGCCLVSVDYRLAPEHRFPAAADDAYDAVAWASAELAAGRPVVLAGDSTGGNLAAVTALRARDSSGPPVALQVLVCPVTDHDTDRLSYHCYDGTEFIMNRRDMLWFWDHYAPDVPSRANPYASPLRAADLSGLPPTYLITAEHDPLRDEGFAYADRLSAARVPVEHRHYGSQIHGFFPMVNVLEDADKAVAEAGSAIRAAVK